MKLLQDLLQNQTLYTAVNLIVSPKPIYWSFHRNPEVLQIREAWATKILTPDVLKSFVETILQEFQPHYYLTNEFVLIALCVALQPFKDEELPNYLITQCSKCKFTETPMLGHIAQLVLEDHPLD